MNELSFKLDCDENTLHFHDEMEIMYVLSGRIAVMMSNTNFVLGPEDFIVFNPYEQHTLYREKGNHTLSLYISSSILQYSKMKLVRCCSSIRKDYTEYLRLIRIKLALLFRGCCLEKRERLYILSQLFSLLSTLKQEFETDSDIDPVIANEQNNIMKALRYIGKNYTENLSLQQVADHVFWSKSHFSRAFHRQTGSSFTEYVRSLRLNMSLYLLQNTNEPVVDIALKSGFSDVNTFIANFKRIHGCTPGEYRKQLSQNENNADVPDDSGNFPLPPNLILQPGLSDENNKSEKMWERKDISFMSLLRYAPYEEYNQPLNKKIRSTIKIHTDIHNNLGVFHSYHNEVISVGWADSLLQETIRNAIREAKKNIRFRYVAFHGLLDDSLDVYHEDETGQPWINYTYIDMIIDFLISVDLSPWIEFGYTPKLLAPSDSAPKLGDSTLLLPGDFEKWKYLIKKMMEHFTERYGREIIRHWRYSPSGALISSFRLL